MSLHFFDTPILNAPYAPPDRHWELDERGQPTDQIVRTRRRSSLISPIPQPRKASGRRAQADLYAAADGTGIEQEYNPTEVINGIRSAVESWRALPESQWNVTPATSRLLRHWRDHKFANQRPFFCQIEAVETVIWLTEAAPRLSPQGRRFWAHLEAANAASNPELMRLALKLATGAGKTTVVAMTDWFADPARELDRMLAFLEEHRSVFADEYARRPKPAGEPCIEPEPEPEPTEPTPGAGPPAAAAEPPPPPPPLTDVLERNGPTGRPMRPLGDIAWFEASTGQLYEVA